MDERFRAGEQRPTIPWGSIAITAILLLAALSVIGAIVRTVIGVVKLVIVVVLAVAVISWVVGKKTDR